VRRRAFVELSPDAGPAVAHPTAGAACVGARSVLVAYNLWLSPGADVAVARAVAGAVRGPALRALGLDVGGQAQVSANLLDPLSVGPDRVHDEVAARAPVARAELVGLVPAAVLEGVASERWAELDLDPSRTIESRLGRRVPPAAGRRLHRP
jgi:glutamate formiminotransferase